MKLKTVIQTLDSISPFDTQEEWDNSGLVVGDLSMDIGDVYISLDADLEVLSKMPSNSLLVVHHPPIFKGLKELSCDGYPNKILIEAIKRDIAIVAMHTNYDLSHLNRYVLNEVLGYKEIKEDPFVLYFEVNKPFDEFAKEVANKLDLSHISAVKANDEVKIAALTTGSGSDLANTLEADCFLTGDIKYHLAKEALENGLSLLDIKHYESERFFAISLQKELQNKAINGIIANSKNPFISIKG
jgi:dinuclear metal center YbgI/SA1388 family protein